MAERQFVIVIKDETSGGVAGKKVGGAGGIQFGTNATTTSSQGASTNTGSGQASQMLLNKAKGIISVATAVAVVDKIWSYNNSLIEIKTGSRELQERTSYNYNHAKSIGMSALSGGALGSQIGGSVMPGVGHVAGFAIGAVLGTVFSEVNRQINLAMERGVIAEYNRLEKESRFMATQRVTVSGSRYMNATQM